MSEHVLVGVCDVMKIVVSDWSHDLQEFIQGTCRLYRASQRDVLLHF